MNTILDDYPALHDLVYSLSLEDTVKGEVKLLYENEEAYQRTRYDLQDLLLHAEHPVQDTISVVKGMVQRVLDQDALHGEGSETEYAESLFGYIDAVRQVDLGITDDVLNIMEKMTRYDLEVYGEENIEQFAAETLEDLEDPDTAEDLSRLIRKLAGMLALTRGTMQLDSEGNLVTDGGNGETDLGIGDSSSGAVLMLAALSQFSQDPVLWGLFKDLIREGALVTASSVADGSGNRRKLPDILKDMMTIDRSYFTRGGEGNLEPPNARGDEYGYGRPLGDPNVFSNSESGVAQLFSHALQFPLFLRSDREESLLSPVDPTKKVTDPYYADPARNKNYFIDLLLKNLAYMGFDPDNEHLEESIYDLIRFDTFGRDRVTDAAAWPVSFLEQLLFLNAAASNAGWSDGGLTGEIGSASDPSQAHGHGSYAGGITLNDSLFAMGGSKSLGMSTYDLAFQGNGTYIFRSRNPFTWTFTTNLYNGRNGINAPSCSAGFSPNFFAQNFMSGPTVGDLGMPGGGNPAQGTLAEDAYRPYCADGIGDSNTARFLLYWMVRACWNGEGPYYFDPSLNDDPADDPVEMTLAGHTGTWKVFYRPNGQVYALRSDETGDYLYPADGDDPEDEGSGVITVQGAEPLFSGRRERSNRFRPTWTTDHVMIYNYFFLHALVPGMNPGKCITPGDYDGNTTTSSGVSYEELVPAKDPSRACASQVEAIFRNFQWLVGEKKFAIVVPMALRAMGGVADASLFQIVEGNGVVGLTHARLRSAERVNTWAIAGNTAPSRIPGDYRVDVRILDDGVMRADMILGTLKNGTMQPAIVTHNAPGVCRFAFPRSPKNFTDPNDYGLVRSGDYAGGAPSVPTFVANENDPVWNRRNSLLPVVIAALGTLLDHQNRDFGNTDPKPGAPGMTVGDYNRAVALMHMKKFNEGLMGMILSRFYYKKTANGRNFALKTWIPKINGDRVSAYADNFLARSYDVPGTDNNSAYGGELQRAFYQPVEMRTKLNMLYDAGVTEAGFRNRNNRCVGLLPLVTAYNASARRGEDNPAKTRLVSTAFKMLLRLSSPDFNDSIDMAESGYDTSFDDWGARHRLCYGLEQVQSATRFTRSPVLDEVYGDKASPLLMTFPRWMFAAGTDADADGWYDSYTNVRSTDNVLDEDIREGTESLVDTIAEDDWGSFNRTWGRIADMTTGIGPTAGAYDILESGLTIADRILTSVPPPDLDECRALVNTLGVILAPWDADTGTFLVQDEEIVRVVTDYLPKILRVPAGHRAWKTRGSLSDLTPGGTVHYVLNTVSSRYPTRDLLVDLNRFLGRDLVLDPDSPLYQDIVKLMRDSAEAVIAGKSLNPAEFFGSDFEYVGGINPW